jgi:hypothetical protein
MIRTVWNVAHDERQRLLRLERILTESGRTEHSSDPREHQVATERIRQLTSELRRDVVGDNDEVDAVMVRLLLNDYVATVARLRGVARDAENRILVASRQLKEARLRFEQGRKLRLKRDKGREGSARL